MSTCDNFIKKAIERNCDEPFVPGLELVGYIGNRAQIDFANVEFVQGSKNEISALPLVAGAKIFPVYQTGKKPDGEFFFIQENRAKHLKDATNAGNSAFEIKGFYQGLTLAEGSLDPYSDDANGGWSVALEEEKSPTSGLFLNAGSYSATKTLINTLVNGE